MKKVRPTIAFAKTLRTVVVVGCIIPAVFGTPLLLLASAFGPGEPATGQTFEDFVQKTNSGYYTEQGLVLLAKFWIYICVVLIPHKIILRSGLLYRFMLAIQSVPVLLVAWDYFGALYFSMVRQESIFMHLAEFLIFTILLGGSAILLALPPTSLWISQNAKCSE